MPAFLDKLSIFLAKMENLRVEPLVVRSDAYEPLFPQSFCAEIQKFKHLKTFVAIGDAMFMNDGESEFAENAGKGFSTLDLIKSLEGLPNIEHIELEPNLYSSFSTKFRLWKLKSSLKYLGMLQIQLSYCDSKHVLESITYLNLHCTSTIARSCFPLLPNLATLGLFGYENESPEFENALQHFSHNSPFLATLILCSCRLHGVPKNFWSGTLATVKHLEMYSCYRLNGKDILAHATHLRRLMCDFNFAPHMNTSLSFEEFLQMLLEGNISKDLRTICFRPFFSSDLKPEPFGTQNFWLEKNIPAHWPKNITWDFIGSNVGDPDRLPSILDVPKLLLCAKKYHKGPIPLDN